MAQGQARKAHAAVLALAGDHKGGLACVLAGPGERHLVAQGRDGLQQLAHLGRGGAVIERGDQADRLAQQAEVLLQLGFEGVVEHGYLLGAIR